MSQTTGQSATANQECGVQLEDVYILVVANGGITGQSYAFRLAPVPGQPGAGYFDNGVINFRHAGPKKFDLHFVLENRGGDLRFLPDIEDAIWIKEGGPCPTGPSQAKDEFPSGSVSADGMTLTIENKNKKRKTFVYTLRFQAAGGGDPVEFDPVIENGGGGNQAY